MREPESNSILLIQALVPGWFGPIIMMFFVSNLTKTNYF
jgi:uncharacterized membrane protein YsdA (DUF1294 family)